MTGFVQDVRYALRSLAREPGFAVAAIATLALGICATTIVYSLVDGILLRPLPIRDPDRVVLARELTPRGEDMSISLLNFRDWKARAKSFEALAAWRGLPANLTGLDQPRRIMIRQVTWNLFDVLGVQPVLGRGLTEADEEPNVERVALISYRFWQRDMGGETSAIGRRIALDDTPVTIVGVLPQDFTVAREEDAFLPLGNFITTPRHFTLNRGNHFGLAAIGRLKPGVSVDDARAEVVLIASQLAQEYPNTNSGQSAMLVTLHEVLVRQARPTLIVLLVAVGAMLLIACVNIANLLLVRGAGRAQELEVRRALGARRWRIARQLLTESVLLALAGGAVGIVLAGIGFDAFMALVPPDQPRVHLVALDARVLMVTTAVSIGTGLLFGIVPALVSGSARARTLLRSGRVAGPRTVRAGTRRLLLVSELSLALVLLAAAGLMVRTMGQLLAIDPGFASDQVLSAQVSLPQRYQAGQRIAFYGQVEERVRALPGVVNAAFTNSLPVQGSNWNSVFIVERQPVPARADLPSAAFTPVTSGYFDTMGIPVVRGRKFEAADSEGAPHVTVVNESLARRFWPDGDALGKRVKQGWPEDKTPWREIVGVVRDVKTARIDQPVAIQAYLPLTQEPVSSAALVVRASGEPAALRASVEAAIREVDSNLPVYDVRTLDQVIEIGVGQQRLLMVLLLGFGGLALLMAAVGVFGVTAYTVAQRTHELGVRMALGADGGRVLRLVLSQELRVCAAGIALGLVGALATVGLLGNLLFGIAPRDPSTIAGVTALLLVVTAVACYLPARRATRVDPVQALRCE